MPSVLLGLVLPLLSKFLLAGTLVLIHVGQQRLRSVPAPFFRRGAPVAGRTRLSEGVLGLGACYALCAAVFFFAFVGQPDGVSLALMPADGSPAQQAGLQPGDRAHSVGGTPVKTFDEFRNAVAQGPQSVSIEVEREGRLVSLRITKDTDNRIGVMPEPGEPLAALPALSRAVVAPAVVLKGRLSVLMGLFNEPVAMSGAIGVGKEASAGARSLAQVLGWLMTFDLILIGLTYSVVLAADTRSRVRYQAAHAQRAVS